jgi:hypothetical protein
MAVLMGGSAVAATDGVLGSTSSGTTTVSITKTERVAISGMSDIALPPWSTGGPSPTGSTGGCVFSTTGRYRVTASSANTTGADFRLSNGLDFIVYSVEWIDAAGLTSMTAGTALTGRTGDAISQTCGGTLPANVVVKIDVGPMQAAASGAYTDTLTVLVAPE